MPKKFLSWLLLALSIFVFTVGIPRVFAQDDFNPDSFNASPVIFADDTLLVIQAPLGELTPSQRAQAVTRRLERLVEANPQSLDPLEIRDQGGVTFIVSGQDILLTLTDTDATAAQTTRQELAREYIEIIEPALNQYLLQPTPEGIVPNLTNLNLDLATVDRPLLLTIAASLGLFLALLLLNQIFPRIYRSLNARQQSRSGRIPGLTAQIAKLLLWTFNTTRFGINLLFIYLYLVFVFKLFPRTQPSSKLLWGYFSSVVNVGWEAFVDYLPKLLVIGTVVLITFYSLRFIKPIFQELEKETINVPGFYPEWSEPTYRIIEILIFALAAVVIVPYLPGFGSPAFQGVSIFFGVLVSLGSTAAVANAVAGIILIYTRAFQVRDRVSVANTLGDVEEKLLLVTRIRTFENLIVTIPNAVLISSNIINYSASMRDVNEPIMLTGKITLGYDVPWQLVYDTLTAAALNTPDILPNPAPFVLQTSLGDFSVAYELKAYTENPNQMEKVYSDLYQNMQDACNSADIEILSPTYSAIRDGNTSTIPEDYLPPDYKPPGFQLHPLGNLFNIDLKMASGNSNQNGNTESQSG